MMRYSFDPTLLAGHLRELRGTIFRTSAAKRSRALRILALSALVPVVCSCSGSDQCDPLPAEHLEERGNDSDSVELLALTLSPGMTPNRLVYNRLQNELQKIQALQPEVAGIKYVATHDGRTLHVTLESLADIRWRVGLYGDLSCLNSRYQVKTIDRRSNGLIELHFSPVYNLDKVAHAYAALQGVKQAEPARTLSLDSTRTICVTPEGEQWHYVFQRRSDTKRKLYYFTSDGTSGIQERDSWDIPDSAQDFDAQKPTWVAAYWNDNSCK